MPVIQHPFPVTAVQLVSETQDNIWGLSSAPYILSLTDQSQTFQLENDTADCEGAGSGPGLGSRRKAAKCMAECLLLVSALEGPHSSPPFSQYY